jgi:DNA-binding CsgD family transcriptional regulator
VPFWREIWPEPIVDSLGLVSLDASGDGFIACVGLDHLGSLTQRERRLLARVGTHVGAGDRLRRGKPGRLLDEAEAVLSPSGKVLHAVERAKNRIDSLREGRERREEARKMQHDPEKALEIWRGLVAGRWSLVDHFDTDGKRFLLAVKNTPGVEGRADLTSRERRVTALAAMGHRDKEIAYILGLSVASVTAAIHRARGKLGVRTRAELAAVWRRGGEA